MATGNERNLKMYLLTPVSFHLQDWNPRYIQPQEQPQPQGEPNHQRTFFFFWTKPLHSSIWILPTFSLFLHPFQIPRMWISMWFYHCEASIVAFLCFQIGKGKYRSQCRPQKILEKNKGMGFGSWEKNRCCVFFVWGEGPILGLDVHLFTSWKLTEVENPFLYLYILVVSWFFA